MWSPWACEGWWKRPGAIPCACTGVALALVLGAAAAWAGTSGRLSGRVLDPKKHPVEGANVSIPSARLGAISDAEGRYAITNVPAGVYELRVSLMGYQPVVIQDVHVNADNTTSLDVTLSEAPVQMKEVVIKATRPVVDPNLTSNLATVDRTEIQKLPVQELQEIVALQAGVVSEGGELHFRGGRAGEVQFQVDGISVNNSYDNKTTLRLDRSLLEEVQVITGTFDAEYGQAMSGVVNAVLRRGSDRFQWDAEAMGGAWLSGDDARLYPPEARIGDSQNFQLTMSGPLRIGKTTFLINGRRGVNDDWVRGQRFYSTSKLDSAGAIAKLFFPDGDFAREALGYTREWSGVAKLTNRSLPKTELGYQFLGNLVQGRKTVEAFLLEPDGLSLQRTYAFEHGFDVTYTPSRTSYFNLLGRQNYFNYLDMRYDGFYDARYDSAGGPVSPSFLPNYPNIAGVELNRFQQRTNSMQLKTSYVNESIRHHRLKFGGEFQWPDIQFGHPGVLTFGQDSTGTGKQVLQRKPEVLPGSPAMKAYWPVQGASYAQDDMEWEGLHLRAGIRFDYFDARATLPSNLANPANSIAGSIPSVPVRTSAKYSFSPRIGVSYPVTSGTSIYFAYGHFSQMPQLSDIFNNADYSVLKDLQSAISYDVMGNPDVKPEQTVQYQFGVKHAVNANLGLDLNAFYKDIRDLLGTQFVATDNDAEYPRITNVDFGSVIGATLSVDARAVGPLAITADYTWQVVQGDASDPRETANRAQLGLDALPHQIPLDWDQRHTLNLTTSYTHPEGHTASAILRVASGQPFTPTTGLGGFGSTLETNSGRKPLSWVLDLRGEAAVHFYGLPMRAFVRVFNVFDTRFFNGFVFASSGNVNYSSTPVGDAGGLLDPARFYQPRRIEIGFAARGGGGS